MKSINNKFKISSKELISFSKASGDWNPIHYDQEISRRYFTERPIVHGILSLLKVLDEYINYNKVKILSIKCNFKSPIYPDFEYKLFCEKLSNNSENLYLFNDKSLLFNCNLNFNYEFKKITLNTNFKAPSKANPFNNKFKDLNKSKGKLELQIDSKFLKENYQSLIDYLSIESLVSLISTSKLVGMVCPGLNSIYSSLDFSLNEDYSKKFLHWEVKSASKKFLPVNIYVTSSGLRGTLNAFYREEPIQQIGIKELSEKVEKKIFLPKNVLIIGGSRGLGEITAKLLSFRNANLKLTYNKGVNDADRIAKEIIKFGHKASCSYLNILELDLLDKFINENERFDQIYFYASPRIKNSNKTIFDFNLYENYNKYYIKPLIKLAEILGKNKIKKSKIFYPSTIFLDEDKNNSFQEYQASKLLGELITENINEKFENISILSSRLPRLLTDQTSKINNALIADSIKVINEILNRMYL